MNQRFEKELDARIKNLDRQIELDEQHLKNIGEVEKILLWCLVASITVVVVVVGIFKS